jgi:hypothetical protein
MPGQRRSTENSWSRRTIGRGVIDGRAEWDRRDAAAGAGLV